jgi:hypothetical protein
VEIVEQLVQGKFGPPEQCEDGILVTGDFAAVIDGGTDKTGKRYDGITGGRFAMLACSDALQSLEPNADAVRATAVLTKTLAGRLPGELTPRERPEAVLTVYSRARREIWQLGDVGFWHPGVPEEELKARKTVDRYAADIRAAVIRVALAAGQNPAQLARDDPGRLAISSLLGSQADFRNNLSARELAYPAIDGAAVPASLLVIHKVPDKISQVVIASDGYPRIQPTLLGSEQALARLLKLDPLCIEEIRGTKGVLPGASSFDDRAYLRLAV